jgi:hypothetical protein
VAAAGAITAGAVALTVGVDKSASTGQGNLTQNFYSIPTAARLTEEMEECWYYYPDNITEPVMTRSIKLDTVEKQRYCQWLQNDVGNYYYDKNRNTIYIKNHRMWNQDFSVRSLPTDPPQLSKFLANVQGNKVEMEHISSRGPGLFVIAQRDESDTGGRWRIVRHYNVLDEDYFRCDWPSGSKIIDERDSLHKRGWAYFKIEGEVAGRKVLGAGQIPFTYETSKKHKPWLKLDVADYVKISDFPSGAGIRDADGKVIAVYPAGSFFKGLARPWMGMHTIDTIRRDAACQRLGFETKINSNIEKAEVTVFTEQGKLIYTIDMQRDAVDKITFDLEKSQGQLTFSYLNDIAQGDYESSAVKTHRYSGQSGQSEGLLWLLYLAGEKPKK